MYKIYLFLLFLFCLPWTKASQAQTILLDSLRGVLEQTTNQQQRVNLLLNLKDLSEGSELDITYSTQLFNEAAKIRDTYAMSVAMIPIINTYADYKEKSDSLDYYINLLRALTPGTPEEGFDVFTDMSIKLTHALYGSEVKTCYLYSQDILQMYQQHPTDKNGYETIERLLLTGLAKSMLAGRQNSSSMYVSQIGLWEQALALCEPLPIELRKWNVNLVHYMLSRGYNQAKRYNDQLRLTQQYIALLDKYYHTDKMRQRRPYLYTSNTYVRPYQQLIGCAISCNQVDSATLYFERFYKRMQGDTGRNLVRNKAYVYEMGYRWHGTAKDYKTSVLYCDSLIHLMATDMRAQDVDTRKFLRVYRDRASALSFLDRPEETCEAFDRALTVQDSIFKKERHERIETIRHKHNADKLQLEESQLQLRNKLTILTSSIILSIILICLIFYCYRYDKKTRLLKNNILRNSRKAQESEHMKSIFTNAIFRGVHQPLSIINKSIALLMNEELDVQKKAQLMESLVENTERMLSTLDNTLEASNLDSLTEELPLTDINIDELCRAELLTASRLKRTPNVTYHIEAPEKIPALRTHAKYFSFVLRALLSNATKYTEKGSITMMYSADTARNRVIISITDTGCGISPEQSKRIFDSPAIQEQPDGYGLSLAICDLIAKRLHGSIQLDTSYTRGARFIFILPLNYQPS